MECTPLTRQIKSYLSHFHERHPQPIAAQIPLEADNPVLNVASFYYIHLKQNRESLLLHRDTFHTAIDTPPPALEF